VCQCSEIRERALSIGCRRGSQGQRFRMSHVPSSRSSAAHGAWLTRGLAATPNKQLTPDRSGMLRRPQTFFRFLAQFFRLLYLLKAAVNH
jgi:hypothetical protein